MIPTTNLRQISQLYAKIIYNKFCENAAAQITLHSLANDLISVIKCSPVRHSGICLLRMFSIQVLR